MFHFITKYIIDLLSGSFYEKNNLSVLKQNIQFICCMNHKLTLVFIYSLLSLFIHDPHSKSIIYFT